MSENTQAQTHTRKTGLIHESSSVELTKTLRNNHTFYNFTLRINVTYTKIVQKNLIKNCQNLCITKTLT